MSDFKAVLLVVDDEPAIREISSRILSLQGYYVVTAEDGIKALEVLTTLLPHLILSDLRMPRMDGFELLSIVRQRFPEIAVIAISGHYDFGSVGSPTLPSDAFFSKGHYSLDQLFLTVTELIQRFPIQRLEKESNPCGVTQDVPILQKNSVPNSARGPVPPICDTDKALESFNWTTPRLKPTDQVVCISSARNNN